MGLHLRDFRLVSGNRRALLAERVPHAFDELLLDRVVLVVLVAVADHGVRVERDLVEQQDDRVACTTRRGSTGERSEGGVPTKASSSGMGKGCSCTPMWRSTA